MVVDGLTERLDRFKTLVTARAFPVLPELGLVSSRPFDHEPAGPRRQVASDDDEVLDVDRGLIAPVRRVEMRPCAVRGGWAAPQPR
jgi:hypothetical protein